MKVYLHNAPLRVGMWHPIDEMADLKFTWTARPGMLYTLAMYDIDAPRPSSASSSPYMHLLVSNIPSNNIDDGNYLFDYLTPKPPRDSDNHRYPLVLFSQSGPVVGMNITQRSRFPLDDFIIDNGLSLIDDAILEVDPVSYRFSLMEKPVTFNPRHHLINEESNIRNYYADTRDTTSLLLPEHGLDLDEELYCSCVVKVAAKQPGQCNFEKAWFEKRENAVCYNPYAVCAGPNSVGTTSRRCGEHYNYDLFTDDQLRGYASLKQISLSEPLNRQSAIRMLKSRARK